MTEAQESNTYQLKRIADILEEILQIINSQFIIKWTIKYSQYEKIKIRQ